MGLTVQDKKILKYSVVDPNNTKYRDVFEAEPGINNTWDVYARVLS